MCMLCIARCMLHFTSQVTLCTFQAELITEKTSRYTVPNPMADTIREPSLCNFYGTPLPIKSLDFICNIWCMELITEVICQRINRTSPFCICHAYDNTYLWFLAVQFEICQITWDSIFHQAFKLVAIMRSSMHFGPFTALLDLTTFA